MIDTKRVRNPHRIVKLLPVLLSCMHEWIISFIKFNSTSIIGTIELHFVCKKKGDSVIMTIWKLAIVFALFTLMCFRWYFELSSDFERFVPPYWLSFKVCYAHLLLDSTSDNWRGMFVCIIDRHGEHKMRKECGEMFSLYYNYC